MLRSIIAIIIISLSIGFTFMYAKPMYDRTNETRQKLEKVSGTFTDVQKIKDLIDQTSATLSRVPQTSLDRFNAFIPETVDPIRFANMLKTIGVANNLVLQNIKVDDKTNELIPGVATSSTLVKPAVEPSADQTAAVSPLKKYKATKASFAVVATYSGFLSLLEDLENSIAMMNITSLSFREYQDPATLKAPVSKTPPPALYEYTVELETYSFK